MSKTKKLQCYKAYIQEALIAIFMWYNNSFHISMVIPYANGYTICVYIHVWHIPYMYVINMLIDIHGFDK